MNTKFSRLISLLFILLIDIYPTLSQDVTFNLVPPPEENPWNIVVSITQDTQGYMWFAGNGIHRYDGVHVISYRNDPLNPNSLVDNAAECLFADDNSVIWIGTLGFGLDRFDPVKNIFTHYRHQPDNAASLTNDTVTAITKDHEGNMWIGTHGGLNRLDTKTGKFIHYRYNANDSTSLSNNIVRVVYVDRQNVVWVGTGDPFYNDVGIANKEGGLNQLDKETNKFTRYLHNDSDPYSLADNRVRAIYEGNRGTFWVGTAGDGLHSLDRATGKFKRYPYDPANPGKLSRSPLRNTLPFVDDHITFISEDTTGSLWIGTMIGGITQYDPKTQKVVRYGTGKDSTGGFRDNSGWAAYSSRDGIFWISTWQAHLFRIDPFQKSFPYYNIGEHTHGIYGEPDGTVWICTHHGLTLMDAKKKILKKYFIDLRHPSNNENINDFFRDRTGKFWILAEQGLISFDPRTEKFIRYVHSTKDKKSISHNNAISICEDHDLNLWIGTFEGLNKMDRKTGEFIHYPNTNILNKNIITNLLEDRKNHLWVGTVSGINLFDNQTGKFKNYLKGISIQSILEDTTGILWVGASDGVFRFNPAIDSFVSFVNPGSGTRFKNVFLITEDDQKKVWLYTSSGIFRLNQRRDSSNAFEKGFGKNIVSGGIFLNGSKGEIFVCDQTGYYDIIPDQVLGNFIPPQVAFTDFRLGQQSVMPGTNSILPNGISQAKDIKLNYRQNVFSFDFDILHFSNPQNNQYLFKLENYDDVWRQPGDERRASYFNVPPGHYVFRVKAANSNGVWTEKDIEVIIDPPWWRTWWAYTIFTLLFLVAIWTFIYYRSRKLRQENRILEEKVAHRTAQLQQSLEDLKSTEAQLIQREKMASLGELTAGIAHEIQNPLNFVNNFSEVNVELSAELKDELNKTDIPSNNKNNLQEIVNNIVQNQEKILNHGRRADAIVKGMLQHSRTSTGQKELTDINALADEYLRLSYHGLRAKDKTFNATMQTDFDETIGKINIIPQDIGRVLLNLYNNAFYVVTEKKKQFNSEYEPTVSVSTKKIIDKVEIRVKDNGMGIPQKILDKIFQPFFTTKPTGQGTGLGLSLSYDIIKAHGGELRLETKESEGAEFIITLQAK